MPYALDFAEISKQVKFSKILNHLQVDYEDCRDGLKGSLHDERFIVTETNAKGEFKNSFFCPHNKDWNGSIINFWAILKNIPVKQAAQEIFDEFLAPPKERKNPIPDHNLEYCAFLRQNYINQETAGELECGKAHGGQVGGKVCFKLYNADGTEIVGYNFYDKDGVPMYPPGYKHNHIFNLHRVKCNWAIVAKSPMEASKLHSAGHKNVVGLTRETLTDEQVTLLNQFKHLVFYGCSSHAVTRMAKYTFVRIADDELLGKL